MASMKLKVPSAIALLLVLAYSFTVSIAQKGEFENPKPEDPWFGQPLPPQPRPGYYKFLGDCIDKTTQQCGLKVFQAVVGDRIYNDIPCCKKIVEAGYICNRSLSYILGRFDKFQNQAVQIYQKSNHIFDVCTKLVNQGH